MSAEIRDRIRELRRVKASELVPHPMNPRRHPHYQRSAMRGVLEEIGYADALVVRETAKGLQIIDGHLRAETTPDQEVPVLVVDLNDAEAEYALATHDPLGAMARNDQDALMELLQRVQTEDKAVTDLLEALANNSYQALEPLQVPNVTDEVDEQATAEKLAEAEAEKYTPFTKRGQIWQLGNHRLMCGDATVKTDVASLMGPECASIIADPPYGMRLNADFSGMVNDLQFAREKGIKRGRKYVSITGDDRDFNAQPVIELFGNPAEQLWFGADYYANTLPDTQHSGAWLVWDKRLDEKADAMFGSCFELIWSKHKCKRDILRHKWAGIFGTEKEPQRGRQHPNQKPVALLVDLIGRLNVAMIADPFLGSGTTIIAAEKLGRRCYAMEIEPRYCDVSIRRWEEYTGRKAELIDATPD